jgi:hypothetical protein
MVLCLAHVLSRLEPGVAINVLGAKDERKLLNWEAEVYRQTLPSAL